MAQSFLHDHFQTNTKLNQTLSKISHGKKNAINLVKSSK